MPRSATDSSEWDDDSEDWDEYEDGTADDEDVTMPCPFCNRDLYDDSERCPHCGKYLSREDRPVTPKPWWFIVGFFLCLYAIYRWTFG